MPGIRLVGSRATCSMYAYWPWPTMSTVSWTNTGLGTT